jgi:PilZ domain-containing protein
MHLEQTWNSTHMPEEIGAKGLVERRKHRRFHVQDLTFAVPRAHAEIMGKVIDISMGGLAFQHSADETWADEKIELDIFRAESDFYLTRLECRIMSDSPVLTDTYDSTVRRSCVRFENLGQDQISQLESFINHHTL